MRRGIRWACLALLAAGPAAPAQEQEEKEESRRDEASREGKTSGRDDSEAKEKPRVYTNQDLETAGQGGGIVTSPVIEGRPEPTPRPPSARDRTGAGRGARRGRTVREDGSDVRGVRPDPEGDGVRGVRPGPAEDAGSETGDAAPATGSGEAHWRGRASAARKRVADAEGRVEALEREIAELMQDRSPTAGVLSPNREQDREARLADAREALESAEAAVEAAQEGLEELRREARRAGVPPGWLR